MSKILVENYRKQFKEAHGWLEGVIEGVTDELAAEQINPNAMKIGAQYAHIVDGLDAVVLSMFAGKEKLSQGEWKDKTGFDKELPSGGDQLAWSKEVKVNMEQLGKYCNAVHKAVDTTLTEMSDEELLADYDLSSWGLGMQTKAYLLNMMIFNTAAHTGEIANMKGMKGLQGYPW